MRSVCRFWGSPDPVPEKAWQAAMPFLAVHAAIRVSRMAVRHAAWTDNGRGFSWQSLSWRTSAGGVPAE